jgi:hypothetical protein
VFCYNKFTALLFILVANPIISLGAAIYCSFSSNEQVAQEQSQPHKSAHAQASRSKALSVAALYRQLLLFPDHWFAIWRHNCLLMGYHALVSGSSSYRMEAKGTFLLEGQRMGLPVSPFYSEAKVFVKHVSIEGGQCLLCGSSLLMYAAALSNINSRSRLHCQHALQVIRQVGAVSNVVSKHVSRLFLRASFYQLLQPKQAASESPVSHQ